jgi:hypothetical protein
MIGVKAIRRLNNYDTDALIAALELNEDRLYHRMVLGSVTVVREDLGKSIEYVKALREVVRSERPGYVSPPRDRVAPLKQKLFREPNFSLPYVRHVPPLSTDVAILRYRNSRTCGLRQRECPPTL